MIDDVVTAPVMTGASMAVCDDVREATRRSDADRREEYDEE